MATVDPRGSLACTTRCSGISAAARPQRLGKLGVVIMCLMVPGGLGGCAPGANAPALPDMKQPQVDGMMTPAQQQQEIAEMARKKADQDAKAQQQIQQTR